MIGKSAGRNQPAKLRPLSPSAAREAADRAEALAAFSDAGIGLSPATTPSLSGRLVLGLAVDSVSGRVALRLSDGTGRLSTPRDTDAWTSVAETLARAVAFGAVLVSVDPPTDLGVLAELFARFRVTRSTTLPSTLTPEYVSARSVGVTDLGSGDVWTEAEVCMRAGAVGIASGRIAA